jgi:methionyl-tRNA formyltransferase
MRTVFFGTPLFAVPSLQGLLEAGYRVVAVVTQPDKPRGRKKMLSSPPVKEYAEGKGLRIIQPRSLRHDPFFEELSGMKPDIVVVVAYGRILPPRILSLPPLGCINVHASLLPKYRGAAPIQWAIINGEEKTGVTTMVMDEGLDTGEILLMEEMEIAEEDDGESLGKRLSEMGAALLLKTLRGISHGTLRPHPQRGDPTFAPPLKKEHGKIDWSMSAERVFNFVRGMRPWPGAYCHLKNERIRIIGVKRLEGRGVPGRVEESDGQFVVGTGEGLISVTWLQPEGRRQMSAPEFLAGRKVVKGDFLNGG